MPTWWTSIRRSNNTYTELPVISASEEIIRRHIANQHARTKNCFRRAIIARILLLLAICLTLFHYVKFHSSSTSVQTLATPSIIDDKFHHLFPYKNPDPARRDVVPIRAYDAFNDECIERWVIQGVWDDTCRNIDLKPGLKIDGVWAWVNGTDPAQIYTRQAYRPKTALNMDASHRYGDHSELLYSIRSAYSSLGPDNLAKVHIMASAYPMKLFSKNNTNQMVGQYPSWLNKNLEPFRSQIAIHYDADYFKPMSVRGNNHFDTAAWKSNTIPSFNSLAVESQLFNLEENDSDQLIYFNDDFFILAPTSISDFTSPLHGPVIKALFGLTSRYMPSEEPFQRYWNPSGEEVGIKRAAWVLGQRFPMRSLPYITHHPRSLSLPLLLEAAQTFPDAFNETPRARFRAQKGVPNSIQSIFIASWYLVERHREALLWSWIVAKWGNASGSISSEKKRLMWLELQGSLTKKKLNVNKPFREPLDHRLAFKNASTQYPRQTQYLFSSMDGYALAYLDWLWSWERPRQGLPDLSTTDDTHKHICSISWDECQFASTQEASEFFKHITFKKPKCGDCVIAALTNANNRGLEVFFPAKNTLYGRQKFDIKHTPHLPLTSSWRETDFSLSAVLGDEHVDLRIWSARLVQRYQYILGSTPSELVKMKSAHGVLEKLEEFDQKRKGTKIRMGKADAPPAFVCLNDDIKEGEKGQQLINTMLSKWFEEQWPQPLVFEIGDRNSTFNATR